MNVSHHNNLISFKKSLVAKTAVVKDGKTKDCKIFVLDKEKDKDYFLKLVQTPEWRGSGFIYRMHSLMFNPDAAEKFFVLEDNEENCLGYMQVHEQDDYSYKKVNYIETCPTYRNDKKKSSVKYVGETLLSFMANLSKKFDTSVLVVSSPMERARKFYEEKCGFDYQDYGSFSIEVLRSSRYDKLIKNNENHTKSKMVLYK